MGRSPACHQCTPGSTLFTDCSGALHAVTKMNPLVKSLDLLGPIRHLVTSKGRQLRKDKAHANSTQNNICDLYAKAASFLPPQQPPPPTCIWEVIRDGITQLPPHRTWTRATIPTHTHDHIHSLSFLPLKRTRSDWYKWIFALQWLPGFAAYTSFWRFTVPSQPCTRCGHCHNQSIHGFMTFC